MRRFGGGGPRRQECTDTEKDYKCFSVMPGSTNEWDAMARYAIPYTYMKFAKIRVSWGMSDTKTVDVRADASAGRSLPSNRAARCMTRKWLPLKGSDDSQRSSSPRTHP